jgi:glycosidase
MTEPMLHIHTPDSPLHLQLDPHTGLLDGITLSLGEADLPRRVGMALQAHLGGREERGWTGGLRYVDTETVGVVIDTDRPRRRVHKGAFEEFAVPVRLGGLSGWLLYRLFPTSPYLEVSLEISAVHPVVVRNVEVRGVVADHTEAVVNAPGNGLRPDVPVHEIDGSVLGVSPLGGLRGSSAIVSVTDAHGTTTLWPTQRAEIPDISLTGSGGDSVTLTVETNFAAVIDADHSAELTLLTIDAQPAGFEAIRAQWPRWAQRYGLGSPERKPAWVDAGQIYEVQIGTSYFWGGHSYSRYQSLAELTLDLERIGGMGFSVIQLMPRQPYPSYNVHDYADVSTSYGDEAELRELVAAAHARGMRVILDVLLHGVVDQESVDAALDGIRQGPLADRLEEEPGDTLGTDLVDSTSYLIAWSRHIYDFAEAWKGGSPVRTPLEQEHPEWFFRDSAGRVTGVYTKAFDARSAGWQRYFRASMTDLIRRLDIDGFRFDAPTYNFFPNWSEWSRARASWSALGCLPLFEDLREDIRSVKVDALMYTEPSGPLLRSAMDLNYNYDEQWLVSALADPAARTRHGVRDARDFMSWMRDRDQFLPAGSKTAHHIDSHDTFWWPHWGKKWRREQFGIDATRMLTVVFLALDGPFMMFTGGEEGIEAELRLFGTLRARHPELWAEAAVLDVADDPTGSLVIVERAAPAGVAVIVNATGFDPVALPERFRTGWTSIAESGSNDGVIAPLGFVVLAAPGSPVSQSIVREHADARS